MYIYIYIYIYIYVQDYLLFNDDDLIVTGITKNWLMNI